MQGCLKYFEHNFRHCKLYVACDNIGNYPSDVYFKITNYSVIKHVFAILEIKLMNRYTEKKIYETTCAPEEDWDKQSKQSNRCAFSGKSVSQIFFLWLAGIHDHDDWSTFSLYTHDIL